MKKSNVTDNSAERGTPLFMMVMIIDVGQISVVGGKILLLTETKINSK